MIFVRISPFVVRPHGLTIRLAWSFRADRLCAGVKCRHRFGVSGFGASPPDCAHPRVFWCCHAGRHGFLHSGFRRHLLLRQSTVETDPLPDHRRRGNKRGPRCLGQNTKHVYTDTSGVRPLPLSGCLIFLPPFFWGDGFIDHNCFKWVSDFRIVLDQMALKWVSSLAALCHFL